MCQQVILFNIGLGWVTEKTEDKVLFLPLYELGSEIKEEIEASISQWNRIGSNLSPIFFTRNLRRFIIWLRVCNRT